MKQLILRYYNTIFILCMLSIVGLSFYLGILEGKKSQGERVVLSCNEEMMKQLKVISPLTSIPLIEAPAIPSPITSFKGAYAGSKNGTKYYTPGCSGLNRIKPENLIWFESVEDATLQGYSPAQC